MVSGRYFNWIGMDKGLSMVRDGFKCFEGFGSVQKNVELDVGCFDETEACCLSFYSEYLHSTVQTGKRKGLSSSRLLPSTSFVSFWWKDRLYHPSPLCHSVTSAGRRLSLPYLQ